ncbi:NERD domain-containing protein [Pseudoxanthomonas sp. LH2527]|uniref:nuclease-related domain-containing protein n=1 Tax=Pseudoxanthomonas sp. LH2527 TaxID=2923249 RepID=UPI001F134723|nr:nuclease-related domain-containing protein [Pseudoxanthomonas sp. LH2527]MCH6485380.1 NERD domain-containing protein [Pseudoxanthomonas sp. LH2527]
MKANLILLAAFAVSLAFSAVTVFGVLIWKARIQRRSPLHGRQVGHVPGQQLVKRHGEAGDGMLTSGLLMYLSAPTMLMAWALVRVPPDRMRIDGTTWVYALGAVVMFGWGAYDFIKHFKRAQNAKDGLLAERVTGMQLNRLVAEGCLVLHDLPAENFNIDHIVIGPRAVYAVETKSFRRPRGQSDTAAHRVTFDGKALRFADFVNTAAVEQAARQAQWLKRKLHESLGMDIPVVPALALPGWYIDKTEAGKTSDVVVFTPMGKGADFLARGQEKLAPEQRRMIAQALAVRYPAL